MLNVSAPGPVSSFSVVRRGSTHLQLTWDVPKVINGRLIGYSLAYKGRHPLSSMKMTCDRFKNVLKEYTHYSNVSFYSSSENISFSYPYHCMSVNIISSGFRISSLA